ncbi:MAG: hypothetical protein GXP49_11925, partial [Deltaproteobacteria bacterium]|nr:hypothetical protein [Deltaproteobacteria bacterium]
TDTDTDTDTDTGCAPGYAECDGDPNTICETRLTDNVNHCGSCDNDCTDDFANGNAACQDSKCVMVGCEAGYLDCDQNNTDCEVDKNTDPNHCGSCDNDCTGKFANAEAGCDKGTCVIAKCNDGFANCDNDLSTGCETDLSKVETCGSCDNSCVGEYEHASAECVKTDNGFECQMGACDTGFADCDKDKPGCETDLSDPKTCGACDNDCSVALKDLNVEPLCEKNGDKYECKAGACIAPYADCDANTPGCETDTDSSLENCGGCNKDCTAPGLTCNGGQCGLGNCPQGTADCMNGAADGCETTLGTVDNCSKCGDSCEYLNGTGKCTDTGSGFECQLDKCNDGYADCNDTTPGCETDLSDPKTCGACDNDCTDDFPNAEGLCEKVGDNYQCKMGACNTGYADCDSNQPGCETKLGTVDDCSACNDKCEIANTIMTCDTSSQPYACKMTGCEPGYKDCDSNQPGCETNTQTDPNNCNDCGNICDYGVNTEALCENGACKMGSCLNGYLDCVNGETDGCETDPQTSAANCGGCAGAGGEDCTNKYANADGVCNSGACAMGDCKDTYWDVNNSPADGCEYGPCTKTVDTETECNMKDDDCDSHVDMDPSTLEGLCQIDEDCIRPADGSSDQPCSGDGFCIASAAGAQGYCSAWCWTTYQDCTIQDMECDAFTDLQNDSIGGDGVGRCMRVADAAKQTKTLGESCTSDSNGNDCKSGWCLNYGDTSNPDYKCSDICAHSNHCSGSASDGMVCSALSFSSAPKGTWARGFCAIPPATGGIGQGGDCSAADAKCIQGVCVNDGTSTLCHDLCCTTTECPAGDSCSPLLYQGDYHNSVMKICTTGGGKTGAKKDNEACTAQTDCTGGWCLNLGTTSNPDQHCTDTCCTDADCENGTTCELVTFNGENNGNIVINTCVDAALLQGPPVPVMLEDGSTVFAYPVVQQDYDLEVVEPDVLSDTLSILK